MGSARVSYLTDGVHLYENRDSMPGLWPSGRQLAHRPGLPNGHRAGDVRTGTGPLRARPQALGHLSLAPTPPLPHDLFRVTAGARDDADGR
jgi:hypothetical protein